MENGLAFIFCVANGLQIGHYHARHISNSYLTWNFIIGKPIVLRSIFQMVPYDFELFIGTIIFFTGLYINIDSDNRLIKLRSNTKTSEYKIPTGNRKKN